MAKHPTVNTFDVLTAAVVAFRLNDNKIVKYSNTPGEIPNRQIVDNVLNGTETATDQDRALALQIKQDLGHHEVMSAIMGRGLNTFVGDVVARIRQETMPAFGIGSVVWAPKIHADIMKSQDVQQEIALLSHNSKYIGRVGDKLVLEFYTISERYSTQYDCWRYTGHDGKGNLVGFLTKNKLTNTVVKIKGRIKSTQIGKLTSGQTTYLNYVKEL